MSAPANTPQRHARLRAHRASGPRRVIPNTGESLLFDRDPNVPAPVDAPRLDDVLRRTREAAGQETDQYPRRPCG